MPKKLVVQEGALGTGKAVCLRSLLFRKVLSAQERLCAKEACCSGNDLCISALNYFSVVATFSVDVIVI